MSFWKISMIFFFFLNFSSLMFTHIGSGSAKKIWIWIRIGVDIFRIPDPHKNIRWSEKTLVITLFHYLQCLLFLSLEVKLKYLVLLYTIIIIILYINSFVLLHHGSALTPLIVVQYKVVSVSNLKSSIIM